jgi:hypothetical protein
MNKKLPDFNGIAPGGEATMQIDGGAALDELLLVTNMTAANIESIKLNLNGSDIIDMTGADFAVLNDLYSVTTPAGYFVIPFSRIQARTLGGFAMGSLLTYPSDNITLKVKIADDAVDPTLKARAQTSPVGGRKRLIFPVIKSLRYAAAASTTVEWNTFPAGALIQAMHFEGNVERLDIKQNNVTKHDNVLRVDNDALLEREGLTPQGTIYHFVPVSRGFLIADSFRTDVDKPEFLMETGAGHPASARVLVEAMDGDVKGFIASLTPTA